MSKHLLKALAYRTATSTVAAIADRTVVFDIVLPWSGVRAAYRLADGDTHLIASGLNDVCLTMPFEEFQVQFEEFQVQFEIYLNDVAGNKS